MTFQPTRVLKNLLKDSERHIRNIARATGSLSSATNEFRWIREHVEAEFPSIPEQQRGSKIVELCKRRANHEPLQYLLGSQPFGDLDIKCRPGVLIPRQETECYTQYLGQAINSDSFSHALTKYLELPTKAINDVNGRRIAESRTSVNILDVCSGSGCISLLLHSLIFQNFPKLQINGWDLSPTAINLANDNLKHNIELGLLDERSRSEVHFHKIDIFDDLQLRSVKTQLEEADIIISNPPYISPEQLLTETTRSVRDFEPRLALVPSTNLTLAGSKAPFQGFMQDVFYAQLIGFYVRSPNCKALIMEVGDREQALRVAKSALRHDQVLNSSVVEIWRDFPGQLSTEEDVGEEVESNVLIQNQNVLVRGSGNMRAVVIKSSGAKVQSAELDTAVMKSRQ